MAVQIIGNHRPGFHGGRAGGIGGEGVPVGIGYLQGTAKANDVYHGQLTSLIRGDVNQQVYFQCSGSMVVKFSLWNPASLQNNPAGILWSAGVNVAGGAIVPATSMFTIFRIEFTTDNEFYIVAR